MHIVFNSLVRINHSPFNCIIKNIYNISSGKCGICERKPLIVSNKTTFRMFSIIQSKIFLTRIKIIKCIYFLPLKYLQIAHVHPRLLPTHRPH